MKRQGARRKGAAGFIVAFLAPAVTLYAVFVVWPLVQSFSLSLYRFRGVSAKRTFVGAGNYERLLQDSVFWKALGNNLWLLALGGLALILLGVAIAHGAQGEGRGAKMLRGIYLFPQIISLVVVAILWMFLLNPVYGLVNASLKAVGLSELQRGWLGEASTALPSVGVAFVWYALGFYVMLFAAGLRALPKETIEAAELDGSRGLHRFRHVTWPMLWSIKRIAVAYVVINVMNVFALVYLMTGGGPDRRTEMMLTYLYQQAFVNSEFGYATALAVASFVVSITLALGTFMIYRRDPTEARA